MVTDLSERSAVITGGAGLIGEALARQLVSAGANVMLADIAVDKAKALASELQCGFVEVDVCDAAANETMIAAAVDRHGHLDMAFLNAGVSLRGLNASLPYNPAEVDLESYRRILSVNIDGPVFGVSAAVPALVENGGGAIIITSSVAGLIPWPLDPVYTITKHGLVGYVRSLAAGLSTSGITINAICPGATGAADNPLMPEGLAVLAPEVLAEAMIRVATDGLTGRALSVVADRDPVMQCHRFGDVEGF